MFVAEPLPEHARESAVTPSEITQHRFDLERRGFNQQQVTAYLRTVADSLDDAQRRETEMRSRLGKAVRRADAAETAARAKQGTETTDTTRDVGDEVAQVLEAARVAGEQRLSAAETSAAKLLANAKRQATKLRADADAVLEERRLEADTAAADIVGQARAEAQAERERLAAEAEALREAAAQRISRVQDECDGLIREAEEARAQILEDMDRRRRDARAQVERLRVGRDRLLRSYEVVRRTLEETTVELKTSLTEAKVKGDTAARVVTAEPLANRQQLEVELADAKLIGRIKTSVNTPDPETAVKETELRSPALPRKIDPPQVPNIDMRADAAPVSRTSGGTPTAPRPPAVAPVLKASADSSADADVHEDDVHDDDVHGEDAVDSDAVVDEELAALADDDLNVVEPADDIENVVAVPCEKATVDAGHTLFELLRIQSEPAAKPDQAPAIALGDAELEEADAPVEPDEASTAADVPQAEHEDVEVVDEAPDVEAEAPTGDTHDPVEMEAQRDAVIAEASRQLERRLKRALADEQNDLLAGLRGTRKKRVELTALIGDVDEQLKRYVIAIHDVAVVAYGAGADLVDAEPRAGELPAGAVEELLVSDVVEPIRDRLAALDAVENASAKDQTEPVRAFYRQRKNDHLGTAASRLAQLLCVAGVCDALPQDAPLPWSAERSADPEATSNS